MKVDIPLESFDANWDDELEASKGAKPIGGPRQPHTANYKTINTNKETFEEVWD